MSAILVLGTVVVIVLLVLVIDHMRRIHAQLQQIAGKDSLDRGMYAVHDSIHPAFSIEQLRRARLRFETAYREQLRLEAAVYERDDWPPKQGSSGLDALLRPICVALIESESIWKEYESMVEANQAVVSGRVSRSQAIENHHKLLDETRALVIPTGFAPSRKGQRVDELLENWKARLGGTGSTENSLRLQLPVIREETFDVAADEGRKVAALMRNDND